MIGNQPLHLLLTRNQNRRRLGTIFIKLKSNLFSRKVKRTRLLQPMVKKNQRIRRRKKQRKQKRPTRRQPTKQRLARMVLKMTKMKAPTCQLASMATRR